MTNYTYAHSFVSGLFIASLISGHTILIGALGCILIVRWGNFILPLIGALILDTSLAYDRSLYNLYGFIFTFATIIVSIVSIKLRKSLKF